MLVEELHQLDERHWLRLGCFAILYLAAGAAAYFLAVTFPEQLWAFLCRLPLYLLAAASLHGISLFTHEGVHGTLCRRPLLNRLVAALCAWPVGQNFAAYKVLHLKHHNHLGKEGDPDRYPNPVPLRTNSERA
ncbi:MAG: fatty acid desaturase [Gemmataceae bacterium]|nr:fatty acid desaturase [Gemmataceae bacterium]